MTRALARGLQAVVVVALAALLAAPAPAAPADPSLASRTFKLSYRDVRDVVALIQPMISDRGSYAVEPRTRSVTVTDTGDVLQRIEDLIGGYDLPPRAIDLVVQLMRAEEGARDPEAGAHGARPRRMGLPPAVIRDLTKWGVITPIGGAAVSTAENETGTVAMGDEYRLRFTVGAVAQTVGVIRVERFVLERMRAADGQPKEGAPWSPLMDLVLNLKDRQTTVLGATSSQDSRQALFVAVTASIVEP